MKKIFWGKSTNEYGNNWSQISADIKRRDNYTCQNCSKFFTPGTRNLLHVHHKVSVFKHGTNNPDNLITLCLQCHTNKHPHLQGWSLPKLPEIFTKSRKKFWAKDK